MGSIFEKWGAKVSLTSEGGNTLDDVVEGLENIDTELLIQRKANEAFIYGEPVEDNEDVDLDDIPSKDGD